MKTYSEADLAEVWSSGYWNGTGHAGPINQAAIDAKNPHRSPETENDGPGYNAPGPLPDDVIVVDDNAVPDFAFTLADFETTALKLAGALAAGCDDNARVTALLERVAEANVGNSIYFSALLIRTLRFLTEDLFAPLLEVSERAHPQHDFRGHLAAVANPNSEVWGGREN